MNFPFRLLLLVVALVFTPSSRFSVGNRRACFSSALLAFLSASDCLPTVNSALDYGHFAETSFSVPVTFQDPGVPPPSFIYASGQLRPPYDITAETMEPSAGCDATVASLCAVQHSIRLVTQARWNACPELDAGGAQREVALAILTAGNYSLESEGASGFEVFAFSKAGQILSDPIRPDLVGEYLDGLKSSGKALQFGLLDYVDWVTRWDGGFVPHYSIRFDSQGETAPALVASYVESCPGSGIRLAVTIGMKSSTGYPRCNPSSNAFCSWHNQESIHGRILLDLLVSRNAPEQTDVYWDISFSSEMKIGPFYGAVSHLSWIGAPGPNEISNPSGLPDSMTTTLAHGVAPGNNGLNFTDIFAVWDEVRDGLPLGLWAALHFNGAAWRGGAVVDYMWRTAALGDHEKVSLVSGVVFNQTASSILTGAVHAPEPVVAGPLCSTCPYNFSLSCSLLNAKSLVAHARMDMLVPGRDWERLTNNPWFGASHADSEVNDFVGFWPEGFHVKAFSWEGGCVADGLLPSNIGKPAEEIFGNPEAHELFKIAASSGGKWTTFTAQGGIEHLAFASPQVRKNGETFYIMASVAKAYKPMRLLGSCSRKYVEDCSVWNAEVLVGAASSDFMSASHFAELAVVGQQVQRKTGPYSVEYTGDFEAWMYDSSWGCAGGIEAAGLTCPPTLSVATIAHLESALDGKTQAWVKVNVGGTAMVAFVAHMTWKATGVVAISDFYILSYLEARPANDRCTTDSDCPAHAACSSSGFCECSLSSGYIGNNSLVSDSCSFAPSGTKCVLVAGMDCTDSKGNIDLKACRTCRESYFCSGGVPSKCPSGQHCPAGSSLPIPCPAGSMANATGMAKCQLCPVGSSSSQAAAHQCSTCLAGSFAGETGKLFCDLCPPHSYSSAGQSSCTACPGATYASMSGATSAEDCRLCPNGFAFKGIGLCEKCSWGMSAPESDATVCRLSPVSQGVLACLGGVIALAIILLVSANRFYHKRSAALKRKADALSDTKVKLALEGSMEFPHPMILLNIDLFMSLTQAEIACSHEGHRDATRLTFIDSMARLAEFQADGKHIIYISHESLFQKSAGLCEVQFAEIKYALAQVMAMKRWQGSGTFLWLDSVSVPQEHREIRKLAVDSLFSYAKSCDVFLAVCSDTQLDGNSTKDAASSRLAYQEHAWCRAELLAFCCGRGPQQVFFYDSTGLESAPQRVIEQMIHVFQGRFSCCFRGHDRGQSCCNRLPLVTPLLSMYIECSREMLRGPQYATPGLEFFKQFVLPRKDAVFPVTFHYRYKGKDGREAVEVRPLFGDLLHRADRRIQLPTTSSSSALPATRSSKAELLPTVRPLSPLLPGEEASSDAEELAGFESCFWSEDSTSTSNKPHQLDVDQVQARPVNAATLPWVEGFFWESDPSSN